MTDGEGADVFIEHVGGDKFMDSLRGAAQGRQARHLRRARGRDAAELDIIELFRNEWQVIGSRIGTPAEMQLTMRLMGEGKLQPATSTRRSRSPRRPRRTASSKRREQTGKVVLVP